MPARRRTPRTHIELDVTLVRRRGGPVSGRTEDLGPGGARVIVDRPLSLDEEFDFGLTLDHQRVDGRARVLRQQGLNCYALRFEGLDAAAEALLSGFAERTT